ncbi:glycosyltransferase family 4 protein [Enterovirga rhinocerotis]|uniref:glycosyltransferase family 4 protein n=1 Tax=Enterovirga rhinocerotis TaxID=1339210 RepID=UPI001415156B|nr:glycosyltransferase family 4 protein [Enterovirga rhinocerotis]
MRRLRSRPVPRGYEALRSKLADPAAVTVWGFLNSEIGLGSSARGLVSAVESARGGVQRFAIPLAGRDNVPFGSSAVVRKTRRNIIVVNPPELIGEPFAFLNRYWAGSHRIAYWAWELDEVPDQWRGAFDLVDEVWSCSTASAASLRRATEKPVHVLPHVVEDWPHERKDTARARLSLPRDGFVFLFAFDFHSGFARKNPLGLIEAFIRAFGTGPAGPHLVLKFHSASGFPAEEARLRQAAARCGRIRLVAEVYTPGEMRALFDAADGFVSLHRAEGFGLNIAEAMMAARPVICTGHSGNLDFTRPDNALLVDASLRAIEPGEYVGSQGRLWAEPDLDAAAEAMRRLVGDPDLARSLGTRGREHVLRHLSKEEIGARAQRLLAASEQA